MRRVILIYYYDKNIFEDFVNKGNKLCTQFKIKFLGDVLRIGMEQGIVYFKQKFSIIKFLCTIANFQ